MGDKKCDKIKVLSVAPIIGEAILRIHLDNSVSELPRPIIIFIETAPPFPILHFFKKYADSSYPAFKNIDKHSKAEESPNDSSTFSFTSYCAAYACTLQ